MSINNFKIAGMVFALGLFFSPWAFGASIYFTLNNNTGYTIYAVTGAAGAGECDFTIPNSLVCKTNENGHIFLNVLFSVDGAQDDSTPSLFLEVDSGHNSIFFDPQTSNKYSLRATVTPTQWDGKTDVLDGTITFNCLHYLCQIGTN